VILIAWQLTRAGILDVHHPGMTRYAITLRTDPHILDHHYSESVLIF
jgi:hypothetical protein